MSTQNASYAGSVEEQVIGTYTVDPTHSQVQFRVKHLGFSRVTGRFGEFSAIINGDPGDLSTLEIEAEINAASLDTRDEKRDAHLRSADFFETEKYPFLTFKSTGVRDVTADHASVEGNLTIRGVTLPVVLEVDYLGQARDPWGGERIAFEAKTRINRKNYGLNWNAVLETGGLLVSEEVDIILDVQAVRSNG